jgi:hypothetical protein
MSNNLPQENTNNLPQETDNNQLYDYKNVEIFDDVDWNDYELECTDGDFDFEDNQYYKDQEENLIKLVEVNLNDDN